MTTVRRTASGAPAPDSFPRWFLLGAAALVLFSLASVGLVRLTGNGPDQRRAAEPSTVERPLRFEDRPDGSIAVVDGRTGALVSILVELTRDPLPPKVPAPRQRTPDSLDHGEGRLGPADVGGPCPKADDGGRVPDNEAEPRIGEVREEVEAARAGQGLGLEAGAGVHPRLVDLNGGPVEPRTHRAAEDRCGAGESEAARPSAMRPVEGQGEGRRGVGVQVREREFQRDRQCGPPRQCAEGHQGRLPLQAGPALGGRPGGGREGGRHPARRGPPPCSAERPEAARAGSEQRRGSAALRDEAAGAASLSSPGLRGGIPARGEAGTAPAQAQVEASACGPANGDSWQAAAMAGVLEPVLPGATLGGPPEAPPEQPQDVEGGGGVPSGGKLPPFFPVGGEPPTAARVMAAPLEDRPVV